ncbi:hypothetical protein KFE98_20510 [bacterium SCSIO 12741]|nr:hypothetical protein KFE98_20510 [bacterium SCSIO 12741]
MKITASTLFSLLWVLILISCQSTKTTTPKAKKGGLTFHFQHISPYCGGARPTEEMENERSKGSAWANQVIYLTVNENDPQKFQTDSSGNLVLPYKAGKYCFFLPYKKEKKYLEDWKKAGWEFDEECLAKKMAECDFQKEVAVKDTTLSFRVYGRCNYQGPIPCTSNPGMPPP